MRIKNNIESLLLSPNDWLLLRLEYKAGTSFVFAFSCYGDNEKCRGTSILFHVMWVSPSTRPSSKHVVRRKNQSLKWSKYPREVSMQDWSQRWRREDRFFKKHDVILKTSLQSRIENVKNVLRQARAIVTLITQSSARPAWTASAVVCT